MVSKSKVSMVTATLLVAVVLMFGNRVQPVLAQSAQIVAALQVFIRTPHTWTATQTFTDIVVNGSCTGCGGGGGDSSDNYTLAISPTTASPPKGILYRATEPFLHTFSDVAGGAGPSNTWLGIGAGNLTQHYGSDANHDDSVNTGIGYHAMMNVVSPGGNTAIGADAMLTCTICFSNVALGYEAMRNLVDGNDNTALGTDALLSQAGGVGSVAVGTNSLRLAQTASAGNTAVGAYSMQNTTTGGASVAIGYQAFGINQTGGGTVAIGQFAIGQAAGNPDANVGIGYQAMTNLTTSGDRNVAIGFNAGFVMTTDDHNTFIGEVADRSGGSAITNSIGLGSGVKVPSSNTAIIGNASVVSTILRGDVQAGASVRSAAVAFAGLPAAPVEGMLVPVTNSNTSTWGATIAGGGANHVLAYYNGTNWTVAAK